MNIMTLIAKKSCDLHGNPTPTIAFLGDSVTQGCFGIHPTNDESFETEYDPTAAYHRYLADMLATLYPTAPVNIINAGIGGDTTEGALARLERDVIAHKPDLTVVCFGLNDCGNGAGWVDTYAANLTKIFTALKEAGSEIIFMTPNMMCTRASSRISNEVLLRVAGELAERQNNGTLDLYVDRAKEAAVACGVRICDVYAKWKRMAACGIDTTNLLSNLVNHPTRELNRLFAYSLLECMMEE
ncbi:MAG: GDSL family lipase [Clostridia bacterium]|nr:GDSL family lipase [Clostridia bacterium]